MRRMTDEEMVKIFCAEANGIDRGTYIEIGPFDNVDKFTIITAMRAIETAAYDQVANSRASKVAQEKQNDH